MVEAIPVCVRWYRKYGISYRDLAEMIQERGVLVDHSTTSRWVQRYAPEIEKRVRWHQGYPSPSWRVDEPMCASVLRENTCSVPSTRRGA